MTASKRTLRAFRARARSEALERAAIDAVRSGADWRTIAALVSKARKDGKGAR